MKLASEVRRSPGPGGRRRQGLAPMFKASQGGDGVLELMIYGDIVDTATISILEGWGYSTDGFVSATKIKNALDEATAVYSKIRLRINSPGGDAFEGIAIYGLLSARETPIETVVDGIAASAASIIAMAGSKRIMGRGAMMMVHDAWTACEGDKVTMRKMGDTLEKIDKSIAAVYRDRTGLPLAEVMGLMSEETWLSAQDCLDRGFATEIADPPNQADADAPMAMARQFAALGRMKHVPAALRNAACACECPACLAGECDACSAPDCEDENCVDCPMQFGDPASNLSLYESRYKMLVRPHIGISVERS